MFHCCLHPSLLVSCRLVLATLKILEEMQPGRKASCGKPGRFIKALCIGLAIIVALFRASTSRAADVPDEELKAMKQRMQELEQRIKVMEQELKTNREATAEREKKTPTVVLGDNGLFVHSPRSNFVAYIHGYIQVDGRFYPDDPGSAKDTLLLRRVRPILEGTVFKQFDYRLMADLGSGIGTGSSSGNNAFLNDAYLNARWFPHFQTQIGKFKSPVGLERLASVADLPFIETGFATQLTPNYDLGVEVHNSLFTSPVAYALGVFNGAADAASDDQDVNDDGKDIAGRIFLQPFIKTDREHLRKLGFGFGGSVGHHEGGLPSYRSPGQQTIFSYARGVNADGRQYRLDPQFFYYWGPFGILGEYIVSSQKVRSDTAGSPGARFDNAAWQVEASYFITGEENSFKPTSLIRVSPLHPFTMNERGWGAFEIAARVQQISFDTSSFPAYVARPSTQEAISWGVGLNWYLNRNIKFDLNYERTSFSGNNSSVHGTVISRDENAVLAQLQVAF